MNFRELLNFKAEILILIQDLNNIILAILCIQWNGPLLEYWLFNSLLLLSLFKFILFGSAFKLTTNLNLTSHFSLHVMLHILDWF